ncbi:MAG: ATP-binding cassette domain-containing protein [Frankiales bacterium]|nr:ATP-binding cassette domain-containing protein [Frankiales bacterium]
MEARAVVRRPAFTLDVDVRVAPGEVVAVLGPNGAGKSTLLRTVCGLVPLDEGSVRLGEDVVDDPARGVLVPPGRRRVGIVFQDYRLFPHLSVLDNVAFGPRCAGRGRAQSRATALAWVERLGLGELRDRRPGQLSGGQAQRVALARALAGDPAALLLDEPLAALDAGTRLDVRSELRDHLHAFDGPTLLVTHDALDALVLADRLVVLEHGAVTQQGSALDVARRPASDYVARLLGLNLLRGTAHDGDVTVEGGGTLHVADRAVRGPVLVAVRPSAVALHLRQPEGSARNVWEGTVEGIESIGDRVRVTVAGPPTVVVDVTSASVAELHVRRGERVWLSAKATELEVYPG